MVFLRGFLTIENIKTEGYPPKNHGKRTFLGMFKES